MKNPDKYIRKFFMQKLSGLEVNGKPVKVYDYHNPFADEKQMIILSTQSKSEDLTKCGIGYECTILIDIITRYPNLQGGRAYAEDIQESVLNLCEPVKIDNFETSVINRSFPDDLRSDDGTESIFRKFIRYNIKLN